MRSTFGSLETARRGLFSQQSALQTTGHNITNANTPGYSRQRVNFGTTPAYTNPGFGTPVTAGQMGTGVKVDTVQRVRDDFLDKQYRGENTKYGYWGAKSDALARMEDVLNEPSNNGLSKVLDQFWKALNDLANNPDIGREAVVQRGKAVADTFHYLANSLNEIRSDLKNQIDTSVDQVNAIARQINELNQQISKVESQGYLPNDLYDKRDLLVDQLSQFANVKVAQVPSGGESPDIAEGRYTVEIVTNTGDKVTLVDGENFKANQMEVSYDADGMVDHFTIDGKQMPGSAISGKLQGLTEAYNKDYPDMLDSLNQLAYAFTQEFNKVHQQGYGLDGKNGYLFFNSPDSPDGAASNISVSGDIANHPARIAASGNGDSGDGANAQHLADVMTGKMTIDGKETSLKDFYGDLIGKMAVNAQEANRMADNTLTLKESAEQHRQSVSGVSLDEEMTNLIRFQHAYNASARMITVVDETLDRIINQMGTVGR